MYSIHDTHHISPLTVPSASPQNVVAEGITSTTITLTWSVIECINRNSLVSSYIVRFGVLSDSNRIEITGVNSTFLNITNLIPNTLYSFEVAGESEFGRGPFSDPAIARTAEGIAFFI